MTQLYQWAHRRCRGLENKRRIRLHFQFRTTAVSALIGCSVLIPS